MNIYGIFDASVNKFVNFFFCESDDLAKRSFILSWTNDSKFCFMFGTSFTLLRIGSADVSNGSITDAPNVPVMTLSEAFEFAKGCEINELSEPVQQ